MRTGAAAVESEHEIVTFLIGDQRFGIEVSDILEVNRELLWTPIPGAPDFVIGAANLRGDIVTIVDMRKILGYEERPQGLSKPVIIVSSRNELVGVLVDQIEDVLTIDPDKLESPPGNMSVIQRRSFSAVMKRDDGIIAILNLEAALA